MPAYWIARSLIKDPVEYKKYTDRIPGIIAEYGGKVLARGGRFQIMEGPDKFRRFVVIEFPTFEQGVACFTSREYDEAAAFRRNGHLGWIGNCLKRLHIERLGCGRGSFTNNKGGRLRMPLPLHEIEGNGSVFSTLSAYLGGEMVFMQQLAHAGKIAQAIFVARKRQ